MVHRSAWYADVDKIFNVNNYLSKFVRAEERVLAAQKEVLAFDPENKFETPFRSVSAAES